MKNPAHGFIPLLALFLLAAPALAAGGYDSAESFMEITWDDLIPESARGLGPFGETGLERYSGNDPAAGQALSAYLEKRNLAPANLALDGRRVKIHGFVVPVEWNAQSELKEFLLAPYFGACIHAPPPPLNQIIVVVPETPSKGLQAMDDVFVYGRMRAEETGSPAGNAAYSLEAVRIEVKDSPGAASFARAVALTVFCGLSLCPGLALAQAAGRGRARLLGPVVGFSAGIMTTLGFSIIIIRFSRATLAAFAAALLILAFLEFMVKPARNSGRFAALAVTAHNILECFAVFSLAMVKPTLGLILGGAMISHNIPLGFSFAGPGGPGRWPYALAAGIVPALAAVLIYLFARPLLSPDNFNVLFSFAGGLMVFVALRDILPSCRAWGGHLRAYCGYCAGIVFMIIMLLVWIKDLP